MTDAQELGPAQRLIREVHVARGVSACIASQGRYTDLSETGYLDREGGGEVVVFDLKDGGRRYRVFVIECEAEREDARNRHAR